jgi:hypothetical protein
MRFSIGLMTLGQYTDLVTISVYFFRSDSTLWTSTDFVTIPVLDYLVFSPSMRSHCGW